MLDAQSALASVLSGPSLKVDTESCTVRAASLESSQGLWARGSMSAPLCRVQLLQSRVSGILCLDRRGRRRIKPWSTIKHRFSHASGTAVLEREASLLDSAPVSVSGVLTSDSSPRQMLTDCRGVSSLAIQQYLQHSAPLS